MSHVTITHTDSGNKHFQALSSELERELYERDGTLAQVNFELNKVGSLDTVVVAYVEDAAVACGGYKARDNSWVEIKRMYVKPAFLEKGFATKVLSHLEKIAIGQGFRNIKLETGKNQPKAIAFYLKMKYFIIPNFGKYIGSVNSVCFGKEL